MTFVVTENCIKCKYTDCVDVCPVDCFTEGENFLASDVAAFVSHTREALELGQDQVVQISRESVVITDFDGNPVEAKPFTVTWEEGALERPTATQDFAAEREDFVNGCVANLRLAHIGTVPVRTSFGRRLPFVYA